MDSVSKLIALTLVWKTQGICKLTPSPLCAVHCSASLFHKLQSTPTSFCFSLVFGTRNDLSRVSAGFRFPAKQGKKGSSWWMLLCWTCGRPEARQDRDGDSHHSFCLALTVYHFTSVSPTLDTTVDRNPFYGYLDRSPMFY